MNSSNWPLQSVRKPLSVPRKPQAKMASLRQALDSGFRRNDGLILLQRRLSRYVDIIGHLVSTGLLSSFLVACSVTVHPEAPAATRPLGSKAKLLATATAVAPTAPAMRARLEQECRRYGNCGDPTNWDALILALEQRPLQLPAIKTDAACPEPFIRSVAGYDFAVIGAGPVYSLFYLSYIRADGKLSAYEQDGWYWNKVVWARDPQYTGPIVIRGRQLDGPATLRFQWIKDGDQSPRLAHSSLHVPPIFHR